MIHLSRLYGLSVASPYELGPQSSDSEASVVVSVCPVPESFDYSSDPDGHLIAAFRTGDVRRYELYRCLDGSYLNRLYGFADISFSSDLTQVSCQLASGADRELLPVILAGQVLATLLMLHGELVLHASAVERSGRTIAFVGNSGGGKSTLAAMLCLDGASLVSDDVLRVTSVGGLHRCYRGGTSLRLRPTSSALVSTVEALSELTADGRHLLRPQPAKDELLPLDGIFLPRLGEAGSTIEIRPMTPKNALSALLQYPRIFDWTDHRTGGLHFLKLAAMVDTVPVYELEVPWGVERNLDFFSSLSSNVFGEEPISP